MVACICQNNSMSVFWQLVLKSYSQLPMMILRYNDGKDCNIWTVCINLSALEKSILHIEIGCEIPGIRNSNCESDILSSCPHRRRVPQKYPLYSSNAPKYFYRPHKFNQTCLNLNMYYAVQARFAFAW